MTVREVRIRNPLGLHARAAARFVHTASRFRSRVTVSRNGKAMDGKSILGILLLAASQGVVLRVDEPTLTPSIRHGKVGDPWYWHGHLTKGFFKGC